MKTKLLALVLLAGSAAVAGPRVFFGVGVGAPVYAPAPVVTYGPAPMAAYVPLAPGPGARRSVSVRLPFGPGRAPSGSPSLVSGFRPLPGVLPSFVWNFLERKTGFEPATLTLAR